MNADMKTELHSIIFVIIIVVSFAGVGWWAVTMAGTLSNFVHPENPMTPTKTVVVAVPKAVTGKSHVVNQISTAISTTYRPEHFLFFNGSESHGIIPGTQNLNVRQFSIAFWIETHGSNNSSFDRPIGMLKWIKNSSGVPIPYGWAFDVGNKSEIGTHKLRFTVGSTLGKLFVTNPATLSSSDWTHLVGTFDGKYLKLYQNSALIGIFPFRGSYSHHDPAISIQLAVGLLPHHYWVGNLSDIRIYQRPLSATEIDSIFHGGNISDGLIGWWKLNEGSGRLIRDSSGNVDNGIVSNATWK